MEFAWSKDEVAYRKELHDLVRDNQPADWWQSYANDGPSNPKLMKFARGFAKKLAEKGHVVSHWPKAYGGRDATPWEHSILSEEMWSEGEPRSSLYLGSNWAGPSIMMFGTEEQKQLHLNNIAQALFTSKDDPTELVRVLRREGEAALRAAGISWTPPERARQTNFVYGEIPGLKREGGSTWQSVVTGRSLETDYLNGEIVLLGRLHGIPTPANATMLDIAAQTAAERRQPGWITPDECLRRIAQRNSMPT